MHWRFPVKLLFLSVDIISDLTATKFLVHLNHEFGALGYIFGSNYFLMYIELFKFQSFALKPKVSGLGRNFYLLNGLNFLCKVWPSGLRPKRTHDWSLCLTIRTIFKICSQLTENAILRNS